MTTYSLFPKWDFTVEGYFYNDDGNTLTDDGYSASLYAKYMFYQNKKETGGASVKTRTGMKPGTIIGEDRQKDAFQSYWMNFPCTIPFFKNKLLLDLMTGLSVTRNYGQTETTAWSFTYSTLQPGILLIPVGLQYWKYLVQNVALKQFPNIKLA